MKPSEEQIGVPAPVDRIVRGENVAETGRNVTIFDRSYDSPVQIRVNARNGMFSRIEVIPLFNGVETQPQISD